MRRDKTGQIQVRIDELADRTNAHWAQLLSSLILSGESMICYDEHYYFDERHREDNSGVQSNRLTLNLADFETQIDGGKVGTPINPSEAALRLAILQTIQQILTFKDNQGEPLNENANQFLVMVPTNMWYVAKSALAVPLSVGGSTNPVKVLSEIDITLVQNPRLKTWSDKFVVFRTDSAIRPLIRQEETPVVLKAITAGSEHEFKCDKYYYGVDTWRNVGFGFWQYACMAQLVKP